MKTALQYWWSSTAGEWLVVATDNAEIIASFPCQTDITEHFMPDILTHADNVCECQTCESVRLSVARSKQAVEMGHQLDAEDGGYPPPSNSFPCENGGVDGF